MHIPVFLPPSLTPLVPHTQLPEARFEVNNKMSDDPVCIRGFHWAPEVEKFTGCGCKVGNSGVSS